MTDNEAYQAYPSYQYAMSVEKFRSVEGIPTMIVCVHGIWNLFISVDIKTEDKPETRIFSDIPSGLRRLR